MSQVEPEKINEGDDILLSFGTHKTYLVKTETGKNFHTHKGFVKFDDIIGMQYGDSVESSLKIRFIVMKPLLRDYIMKCARQTQINYPKDIALIIMFSGIGPGSRVVEAGTGTGALTTAIAHYVKPNGIVHSYDIREEFQKTAQKNLRRARLDHLVELKLKDVTQGIDETNVDSVVLDLAIPWLVVPHAYTVLKPCGTLVSFSPTIDQVVKTVETLRENSFTDVETVECIMRGMQIERGKTRPQTLMTGHTGYITFGRKITKTR